MQDRVTVEIQLFGVFRTLKDGAPLTFDLPGGIRLGEVRRALGDELARRHPSFDRTLIEESALADERAILRDDVMVERDMRLAILPPVCGG